MASATATATSVVGIKTVCHHRHKYINTGSHQHEFLGSWGCILDAAEI
jgi:hypothetical protein